MLSILFCKDLENVHQALQKGVEAETILADSAICASIVMACENIAFLDLDTSVTALQSLKQLLTTK